MSKSQTLKEQQQIWYKKLKDEGFEDIEQDETHLKVWTSSSFYRRVKTDGSYIDDDKNRLFWDTKAEYYRRAGQFLYEYSFECEYDRKVWELHSEGLSCQEISKFLKQSKQFTKSNGGKYNFPIKPNKDNTNILIQNLTKKMIEQYNDKK